MQRMQKVIAALVTAGLASTAGASAFPCHEHLASLNGQSTAFSPDGQTLFFLAKEKELKGAKMFESTMVVGLYAADMQTKKLKKLHEYPSQGVGYLLPQGEG